MLPPGDVQVAPSILAADFGNLAEAVGEVAGATPWLHVDVMDGHFVPNITIGPPVVASLRRHSGAHLDCHLMITEPARYLRAFHEAGASSVTVHVEVGETAALVSAARALGLGVGVACNPDTPAEAVEPFLDDVDLVLAMTVFPGFGGQRFMGEVLPKIARLRETIDARGLTTVVEVDGGIDETTAPLVASAGARLLVAGSAVFRDPRPWEAVGRIRSAASAAAGMRAAAPPTRSREEQP
ncbi:MAG: ribulose-phosphate 3-epimerase [Actinomycetota bacterium]|nr:ribulose-phosphate 3-epimerase [Actinomycetota bacterium]